jgi:hypothetical protein
VLWPGPVPAHDFRWRTKQRVTWSLRMSRSCELACDLVPAYEQKLRACFAHAQVFFQASFSPPDDFLRLSAVDFRFTRLGSGLGLSERRSPIFPCFGSGARSHLRSGLRWLHTVFPPRSFCLASSSLLLSSWPACRFRPNSTRCAIDVLLWCQRSRLHHLAAALFNFCLYCVWIGAGSHPDCIIELPN